MEEVDNNSIDLTVTSPPYDNLRTYGGYRFNFKSIAQELYRVTKLGGVIVWVVGDATIKGSETGTSFKQALYFKEIGFNLHDTMIWRKPNPTPMVKCKRYWNAFEYMFIFSKGKPNVCNYIMEECKTSGRKSTTFKQISKGTGENIEKNRFTKELKIKMNVWDYTLGFRNTEGHPATFPKQLAQDHIVSWSNKNNIVLDPMFGSGITLKMAKKLNRKYIGYEINKEYCKIVQQRLETEKTLWD